MTPLVGNDIVDLLDDEVRGGTPAGAFARRVCAPSELALIGAAQDPQRALWRLWAAKESVFKAVRRVDPAAQFKQAEIVVEGALVRWRGQELRLAWSDSPRTVGCVASAPGVRTSWQELPLGAPAASFSARELASATTAASREARALAKSLAGRSLGVSPDSIEIVRPEAPPGSDDRWGAPEVWLRGQRIDTVTVSMAHHGNYVACAIGTAA